MWLKLDEVDRMYRDYHLRDVAMTGLGLLVAATYGRITVCLCSSFQLGKLTIKDKLFSVQLNVASGSLGSPVSVCSFSSAISTLALCIRVVGVSALGQRWSEQRWEDSCMVFKRLRILQPKFASKLTLSVGHCLGRRLLSSFAALRSFVT